MGHRDCVGPHHDGWEGEEARVVGGGRAGHLRPVLRETYGGARDDAAARILNDSGNGAQAGLGQSGAAAISSDKQNTRVSLNMIDHPSVMRTGG